MIVMSNTKSLYFNDLKFYLNLKEILKSMSVFNEIDFRSFIQLLTFKQQYFIQSYVTSKSRNLELIQKIILFLF